jgi:hypothetical protein
MKTRFNWAAGMLPLAAIALISGCAHHWHRAGHVVGVGAAEAATLETSMTQEKDEHLHSLGASVKQDAQGFVEDSDLFWQLNRPTRLTRWAER